MGCDIHIYAEVKKLGKWRKVVKIFKSIYSSNKGKTDEPYEGRNYDLFGMLANVRNGIGFAGCDLGDGFKPISIPKGLPNDVSKEVKKISDRWGDDGHSHSWLTLEELLNYDWKGQRTKHRGWVDANEFIEFKKNGYPTSYCGGISGRDIKHVDIQTMEKIIQQGGNLKEYYCKVEWESSYYDCAKKFIEHTIPALQKLGKPEDVRIVFWFDN